MLTLYIADAERDVSMKNLSRKEEAKILEDLEYLPITYICPFCGHKIYGDDTNFCPNCGADMRKETAKGERNYKKKKVNNV